MLLIYMLTGDTSTPEVKYCACVCLTSVLPRDENVDDKTKLFGKCVCRETGRFIKKTSYGKRLAFNLCRAKGIGNEIQDSREQNRSAALLVVTCREVETYWEHWDADEVRGPGKDRLPAMSSGPISECSVYKAKSRTTPGKSPKLLRASISPLVTFGKLPQSSRLLAGEAPYIFLSALSRHHACRVPMLCSWRYKQGISDCCPLESESVRPNGETIVATGPSGWT